jgi:hypothetical protein
LVDEAAARHTLIGQIVHKRVESREVRELRGLQSAIGGTFFPFDQLQLAELRQEAQVVNVVPGTAGGQQILLPWSFCAQPGKRAPDSESDHSTSYHPYSQ